MPGDRNDDELRRRLEAAIVGVEPADLHALLDRLLKSSNIYHLEVIAELRNASPER